MAKSENEVGIQSWAGAGDQASGGFWAGSHASQQSWAGGQANGGYWVEATDRAVGGSWTVAENQASGTS